MAPPPGYPGYPNVSQGPFNGTSFPQPVNQQPLPSPFQNSNQPFINNYFIGNPSIPLSQTSSSLNTHENQQNHDSELEPKLT